MNGIETFLAAAIVAGTPLLFATIGEILIERVGNLNLGVEGMMLMGAVMGFLVGLKTSSVFLAILGAIAAGAFGGLIFAFLTITLRANQVVTGLALASFGSGFSTLVGKQLVGQTAPAAVKNFFQPYAIPALSKLPFVGSILFKQDPFVYLGYIVAIIIGIFLYNTSKGLNLRAIGENPGSADAASINITLYKYIYILIGGALCGLGGAYLSLVYIPNWQENVVAGRGWIAIALVIFSAWNPYKAVLGAVLFGGLDIIGLRLQSAGIHVVSQYMVDMLPYIVTITVLVIVSMRKSKRNSPPMNLGVPYFREER
ncbi:ABC transporter permease [Candidatus Clostridium radicumherbarum]|uniref:ABC transporter permease n=1 Tax=Candidatus Clostridium radicumherbarum TaxID=3381662 RepID=A0ABW8TQQ6_9CLOT